MDALMRGISKLGDNGVVFIILALLLLCFKKTRIYGAVLSTALLIDVVAVNVLLKPLVGRARPYEVIQTITPMIAAPHDYSFPSGHTAAAFAAATALRTAGKVPFWGMSFFAGLMGFSRLYLQVHYPSDIVAGAVSGMGCGVLSILLWKKLLGRDLIKKGKRGR